MFGHEGIMLHLMMTGHCPETQFPIIPNADEGKLGELIQIDEYGRLSKAEVHQRDQALTASQDFGVVAIFG